MSCALANATHLAKLAQAEQRTFRRRTAAPALTVLRPMLPDASELRNEVVDLFPPTARRLARADPRTVNSDQPLEAKTVPPTSTKMINVAQGRLAALADLRATQVGG